MLMHFRACSFSRYKATQEALNTSILNLNRELSERRSLVLLLAGLRACSSSRDLHLGEKLHSDAAAAGRITDKFVSSSLVNMYGKCGSLGNALEIFHSNPAGDVVLWTSIIMACTENGKEELALELFKNMKARGLAPNSRTLLVALKACTGLAAKEESSELDGKFVKLNSLEKGMAVHSEALNAGCEFDDFVYSTLARLYAECGSMLDSRRVFDCMKHHDEVSWTILVQGYVENNEEELGLELFNWLNVQGFSASARTLLSALSGCTRLAEKETGERVLGRIIKLKSLERGMMIHSTFPEERGDIFLGSSLISMYSKCGSLIDARRVFDEMPLHDEVSYTAMIQGYGESNEEKTSLHLYSCCLQIGRSYGAGFFIAALSACAGLASKEEGKRVEGRILKVEALEAGRIIHSQAANSGRTSDTRVSCSLVNMYSKCGSLVEAWRVFYGVLHRDIMLWNTLLLGCAENREPELALRLYERLKTEGFSPNSWTLAAVVKAYTHLAKEDRGLQEMMLERGKAVHSEAMKQGWDSKDLFLASSLIEMYAKCGSLDDARRVFDKMQGCSTTPACNALISGYVDAGLEDSALSFMEKAQQLCQFDARTYAAALDACTGLAMKDLKAEALEKARKILTDSADAGFGSDDFLRQSVVRFYAKCGKLAEAESSFTKMSHRDVVSWNILVLAYVENGLHEEAWQCFSRMECPADAATMVAVLKACGGLLDSERGQEIHSRLCRMGDFTEDPVLVTCLVDLYLKCGRIVSAHAVFDSVRSEMINPITWTALISGYSQRGDVKLVFELFRGMRDEARKPNEVTFVGLLSACSHAGLPEKARECWRVMQEEVRIIPVADHYHCLVDALGRGNQLDDALRVVQQMPQGGTTVAWKTLLSACAKWKNVELGKKAFKSLMRLDDRDVGAYSLMANILNGS